MFDEAVTPIGNFAQLRYIEASFLLGSIELERSELGPASFICRGRGRPRSPTKRKPGSPAPTRRSIRIARSRLSEIAEMLITQDAGDRATISAWRLLGETEAALAGTDGLVRFPKPANCSAFVANCCTIPVGAAKQ